MPQQSTVQAASWMSAWLLNTLALTVAGRELGHDIPVFVTMIFRSLAATAILTPIVLYRGGIGHRFANLRLNIARNVYSIMGTFLILGANILNLIKARQVA